MGQAQRVMGWLRRRRRRQVVRGEGRSSVLYHSRVCGVGDEAAVCGAEQVAVHQQLGLRGVELRTVNGRWLHELSSRELGELGQAVAEAGLVVPVVDTPIGGWATTVATELAAELDVLEASVRAAAVLGCRRLRVMSYPNDGRPDEQWRAEALRRVRELAAAAHDLGVQLLHENCHGWAGGDPQRTLELLAEVDGHAVRLLFDTGNGVAHGYDGPELLRAVLPFVAHVHVKDGVRAAGGDTVFVAPGTGQARVAECVALLEGHGYRGWYSLEPHVAYVPQQEPASGGDAAAREVGYRHAAAAFRAVLDDYVLATEGKAHGRTSGGAAVGVAGGHG